MIRKYFEKKKMNVKALSEVVNRDYSSFRGQLKKDTVFFRDIAILFNKGVLNMQDIVDMISIYR